MKKFIFLFLFLMPMVVNASSNYIKEFEVLNGTLSIPFNEKNNIYTIVLNEEATSAIYNYKLEDDTASIEVLGNEYHENEENIMILKITDSKTKESQSYTFYLEKEKKSTVSFNLANETKAEKKEIPHLKEIIITICGLIILILFKLLILNFFQKKDQRKITRIK